MENNEIINGKQWNLQWKTIEYAMDKTNTTYLLDISLIYCLV